MPYTCKDPFNICSNDGWCYDINDNRNNSYGNRMRSCGPTSMSPVAKELMLGYVASTCRDPSGGYDPIYGVTVKDSRIPNDDIKKIISMWTEVDTHEFTAKEIIDNIDGSRMFKATEGANQGSSNTFVQHHIYYIDQCKYSIEELLLRQKGGVKKRRNTRRKVRRNMKCKSMKRKSMKRKSMKRKSIKRKSIKRKSMKRKSIKRISY